MDCNSMISSWWKSHVTLQTLYLLLLGQLVSLIYTCIHELHFFSDCKSWCRCSYYSDNLHLRILSFWFMVVYWCIDVKGYGEEKLILTSTTMTVLKQLITKCSVKEKKKRVNRRNTQIEWSNKQEKR
ncbi:hypothetical protein ACOSQ2_030236 [Xanthoceras sorbifolium]